MRSGISSTTVARMELARKNEDLVAAEASLRGARMVSWVRLVMIGLFGLSFEVVGRLLGRPPAVDLPRLVAVVVYAAFALGVFFRLRRAEPSVRKARLIPYVERLVDVAFIVIMATRGYVAEGAAYPEMGAAALAVILAFSVASFDAIQVAVSTALVCVAASFIDAFEGYPHVHTLAFRIGGFVSLGLLVGATSRYLRGMFVDLRRRDNLTRFLSPQVAERVMRLGQVALEPVHREVTVLFTDIRDFTALSEPLPPRAVLEFLDDYFSHLGHIVKAHEGIVNKFLGDGMLALWGVPDALPDHGERAIRAALDIRRRLADLNAERATRAAQPIRVGVGVHSGLVAAGMIGGADQHEYTVIGDAVNVASRIEGLTKSIGTDLLVSETAWHLVQGRFSGERVGEMSVKGRTAPVVVYSVRERTEVGGTL